MPNSEQEEPFSSTLSTRELLLVKSIAVTPISQVMGTAFMRLPKTSSELLQFIYPGGPQSSGMIYSRRHNPPGISNFPGRGRTYSGRYDDTFMDGGYNLSYGQPVVGEIYELTAIRFDARQLAVSRMRQEAQQVGASGVIAVEMKTKVHNWGDALTLECTATGTAVTVPDWKEEQPFTSLMRAQQFWRLWQSGYEPCGIAIGACSYSDCAEASVLQRSYNQEVSSYTASFYDAHGLAMEHFSSALRKLKGIGAVGMKVEYEFQDLEKELEIAEGVENKYLHLITHFVIVGTAIRQRQKAAIERPARTLRILDLSETSGKQRAPKETVRLNEGVEGNENT